MKILILVNFLKIYLFLIIFIWAINILLIPIKIKNLHPLILGLIILIYSILISLNLNIFNKSRIYSIIIFLIIVGGFLILFLYFNRFAINNKIIININSLIRFLYKILLINILILIIIYKNNLFNIILFLNIKLLEIFPIIKINFIINETNIDLIYLKFYNLTLFLIIYLLYTLIIIVKIIFYLNPKSIRQLIK